MLTFKITLDTGTSISVDLYLENPGYDARGDRYRDFQWLKVGDKVSFSTGASDPTNNAIGTLVKESGTCTSVRKDGGLNIYFKIILENTDGVLQDYYPNLVEIWKNQVSEIKVVS